MTSSNHLGHIVVMPAMPNTSVIGRIINTRTYIDQGIGMGENGTLILDNDINCALGISGLKIDNTGVIALPTNAVVKLMNNNPMTITTLTGPISVPGLQANFPQPIGTLELAGNDVELKGNNFLFKKVEFSNIASASKLIFDPSMTLDGIENISSVYSTTGKDAMSFPRIVLSKDSNITW